jgi:hypothetical protein
MKLQGTVSQRNKHHIIYDDEASMDVPGFCAALANGLTRIFAVAIVPSGDRFVG